MKGLKKLLCLVLSLTMVIGTLTVTAIAEPEPEWTNISGANDGDAAAIMKMTAGNTYYFKLTGEVYTKSGAGSITVPKGATLYLDLNGKHMYTNATGRSHLINNGTVYIINSQGLANGDIVTNSSDNYTTLINNGVMSISDTVISQGSGSGYGPNSGGSAVTTGKGVIENKGILTLNNCALTSGIINKGYIVPLTDGQYFSDVTQYCADGYAASAQTATFGACGYAVGTSADTYYRVSYYDETDKIINSIKYAPGTAVNALDVPAYIDTVATWYENVSRQGDAHKAGSQLTSAISADINLYLKAAEPVAKVTVNGVTRPFTSIDEAKTYISQNSTNASFEVYDDTVNPETWGYAKVVNIKDGEKKFFCSFDEAKADAIARTEDASEITFKMLADYTASARIQFYSSWNEIRKTIVIDFNGHQVTCANTLTSGIFTINKYGTLKFIDSSDAQSAKVTIGSDSAYFVHTAGYVDDDKPNYVITAGVWTGANSICNPKYSLAKYVSISGDSFSANPETYVAPGFESTFNSETSMYEITKKVSQVDVTMDGSTVKYDSFGEAMAAANVEGKTATIKLLGDNTFDETYTIAADKITLDLNGFDLAEAGSKGTGLAVIPEGKEFIVTDTSSGGTVTCRDVAFTVYGTFRLTGGTVIGTISSQGGAVVDIPKAASVIANGKEETYLKFADAKAAVIAATADGSEATLKLYSDLKVSSRQTFYSAWDEAITRTINLDLNGYKISSSSDLTSGIITINKTGLMNIYDSSAAGTGAIEVTPNSIFLWSSGSALNYNVYGGNFIGGNAIGGTYNTIKYIVIYGGTYDFDPSANVPEDYKTTPDNLEAPTKWTVAEKAYTVELTLDGETKKYETVAEAMYLISESAGKTGEIKVIADTLADPFVIDDMHLNVTVDLNGKTVSMKDDVPFAEVKDGLLTVKNGTIDFTGKTKPITVAAESKLVLNNVVLTNANGFAPVESDGVVKINDKIVTTGQVKQNNTGVYLDTIQASVYDSIKLAIGIELALTEKDAGKIPSLEYTADGKSCQAVLAESGNGVYTFQLNQGINLSQINSDMNLTVKLDGETAQTLSYAAQDYFNQLHKTYPADVTLHSFLSNTLKLSEELQAYLNGSSGIEYAGWEEDYLSFAQPSAEDNAFAVTVAPADANNVIKSATLSVSDKIAISYCVTAEAGTVFKVTKDGAEVYRQDITEKISSKHIAFSKLSPAQYGDEYVASILSGDTVLCQVKYSVNTYTYRMMSGAYKDLALAVYRYGLCAAAYRSDKEEHEFGEATYTWSRFFTSCTAERKCADCKAVETETVDAIKTVILPGVPGVSGEVYTVTAIFNNPAFAKQERECVPDALVPVTKDTPDPIVVPEKHLILNADGSYGGGTGAPLNGKLDDTNTPYYRMTDYYNLKSSDTRSIYTGFAPYQQTDKVGDGVSALRMILNYDGVDITKTGYSEAELIAKYNTLNSSAKLSDNGGSAAGLAAVARDLGYTAEANIYEKTTLTAKLVKGLLAEGKIMLIRYQTSFDPKWRVVIGAESFGTGSTKDDVLIMANPFDAADHYQDGYSVEPVPFVNEWWLYTDQTTRAESRIHECVVITLKNFKGLEYDTTDAMFTNPSVPQRHLLLNTDGTFGGILDYDKYGDIGDVNGFSYSVRENADGTYSTYNYSQNEHFDYSYYAFPDYYNMTSNTAKGKYVLTNFRPFEQTMASSCGISSMTATLVYYDHDFSNVSSKISKWGLEDSVFDLTKIGPDDNDKKQEAALRIYMDNDSYFGPGKGTKFNNYGGVGASKLKTIATVLDYANVNYSNYTTTNGTGVLTYDQFTDLVITNIKAGRPTVISWNPTSGHWETIIGYDSKGTAETYDDVIILADSHDVRDHYQDGYNTYPAETFYARWFNGTKSLGQARVWFTDNQ